MGYNIVQVGMISPKKRGVVLMNEDYQVRGTYPLEYKEFIEKIVDGKLADGGEFGGGGATESVEKFWNGLSSMAKMNWLKKRKDIPSDYKSSLSRDSYEKLPDWIKVKVKKAYADNKIYRYES